ncbi:phage late control D family protein [Halodesulfovibrio aestuarii]|uniref:YqbQ/XkdQ domain-containing protein n=1 Tax=Halodesulfovibrio aestuarii TaxID=126333 RepID=A0A8G2CCD1_9BACT|nr:contractile injection system protein, VgrG/Pvc8 family [Halodesulfovibrio aestuarii]SHJ77586.1 hypothetical protein SAMN05660830_03193 [Halodesulfovibrio aestuarii]
MHTRNAYFDITIRSKNVSTQLAPYITSVTWSDAANSTEADSLDIELDNRDGLFSGAWQPTKGDKLTAKLITEHWHSEHERLVVNCGVFEIDETAYKFGGDGDSVTLKAISAMVKGAIRREKKSRAWENTTFSAIANKIATQHGFGCVFTGDDVQFTRIEQKSESDIAFIRRLAKEHGHALKLSDGKVILMDEAKQDKKPSAGTINKNMVLSVEITDKSTDIYSACEIQYHDAATNETRKYVCKPEGVPTSGQTLKIKTRVESLDAARKKATAALRRKNKFETSGTISCMGNPHFIAGSVCTLGGFGVLNGLYAIEKSTHTTGEGGYTVSLSIRRTVNY